MNHKNQPFQTAGRLFRYLPHLCVALSVMNVSTSILAQRSDYVEVCGIRWAKGNLFYNGEQAGDKGFQPHWGIHAHQWEYQDMVSGNTAVKRDPVEGRQDHFNWGVVGPLALSGTDYCRATFIESSNPQRVISGRLFTDQLAEHEYTGNDPFGDENVCYGDVAYWASKGGYALPRRKDFLALTQKASYQYGYVVNPDGQQIFGVLFTTPEGTRTVSFNAKAFSEDDIQEGLFLPACGRGVSRQYDVGYRGYYWASGFYSESTATWGSIMVYGMATDLRFETDKLIWDSSHPSYGMAVRPVLSVVQGDADDNGVVDVNDVVLTVGYITDDEVSIYENAADCNEDFNIDVDDVVSIVNLVVN